MVQEDQEFPRATEPGQEQDKVKPRQGGKQAAGLPSPSLFHTCGNEGNPAGEQGRLQSSSATAIPHTVTVGHVELISTGSAPVSQVLFSGLGMETVFIESAGLGEKLAGGSLRCLKRNT